MNKTEELFWKIFRNRYLWSFILSKQTGVKFKDWINIDLAAELGYTWLIQQKMNEPDFDSYHITEETINHLKDQDLIIKLHDKGHVGTANSIVNAARDNNIQLIKFLRNWYPVTDLAITEAAIYGSLESLAWFHEEKYPFPDNIVDTAIANNRLQVVEYLHSVGLRSINWFGSDDIKLTKYLHNFEPRYPRTKIFRVDSVESARWLHENNYQFDITALRNAVSANNIDLAEWLVSIGLKPARIRNVPTVGAAKFCVKYGTKMSVILDNALTHGSQEMLEFCESECKLTDSHASLALARRHFHLMNWFYERGLLADLNTACAAGNLELVKFIYAKRPCSLFPDFLDTALHYGNVDVADWLYENNCRSRNAVKFALANHNTTEWAMKKGLQPTSYVEALWSFKLETFEWIRSYSVPITNDLIEGAIYRGNIRAVKWFKKIYDFDSSMFISRASRQENYYILKYMLENAKDLDRCNAEILQTAIEIRNFSIIDLLIKYNFKITQGAEKNNCPILYDHIEKAIQARTTEK